MKFNSAKDIIEVARSRGLDVRIIPGPPPMPVLHVPAEVDAGHATEILLSALKAWRLEIIEELSPCPMKT